ncbi:MAG TPA: hypothetical protein VKA49_11775 [Flavitalea sp.]|nr:hypothetical protein [Flavitalea sp.]
MKRLHPALFIIFLFFQYSIKAQSFDSVLNKLDTEYPQEKLYVQFDKNFYSPGETIWFKAYLFAANTPSLISKTLYAELLDDQGKVLQRKTAPVVLSGAAAAFDLPVNTNTSIVFVRVYTRWMLNFDSSFLFLKALPIVAAQKETPKASKAQPVWYLQFFPEGGDLIQGIESRVAFKATDHRGLPIPVAGDIVDSKGKKIAAFSSVHNGMGYLRLQPEGNEQYKARWKDPSGAAKETNLPTAKQKGLVLEVINAGKKIQFALKRSENIGQSDVHVVAQMHQQLLYRAKAKLANNPVTSGAIPVEGLPTGIVQVTVFSEDEKPLAERIVFVNQQQHYFITDLNAPLKKLEKRQKNVIQIDVPDTIVCNLAVSVTDADLNVPQKGEDDIFSHILLTSDIKGYVHQPGYYFSSEADSVAAHLDLVMMTNGWRRFKWEEVLAGRWPTVHEKPDGYLGIQGKISGVNKSLLSQKEVMGILQTKNGAKQFLTIPIEPDGSFFVQDILFFDTAKIYYQFNNDKDKVLSSRANFDIRNTFINQSLKLPPDKEWLARLEKDSVNSLKSRTIAQKVIDGQKKVQTLATVEVTAQAKSKKQKMDEEYTSGLFTGDGTTFITEDDPFAVSALSVFQYLQGKVAGLQITSGAGTPTLSWRGGTPDLYLDQMQMDASTLQGIPMSDVAMVKVFRPPFFGGFGGGSGGAIAVYTKKGTSGNQNVKGLDAVTIHGYSEMREFYSPDYSRPDDAHSADDFRTTLYWNPFVYTDRDHRRLVLSFHNNDITKRIRVVVEGFNVEGKLTRIEKVFE